MYLLSLLKTCLTVLLGVPGLVLLGWAFWHHGWMLVVFAAAIAAVWPWHKRWQQREAAYRDALRR